MPASSGLVKLGGKHSEQTVPSQDDVIKCPVMSPASFIPMVHESRVRRVLKRIEAGPSQSVRELARQVQLSPGRLQRLFKHETGVNISDLLSESRLRMAAQLLSTSDKEIKEIAYLAGYQHHSSFVRAFQRCFRQSPKEYRRPPAA